MGYSQQRINSSSTVWKISKPFEHYSFVKNKGQFPEDLQNAVKDKILYSTRKGKINLYFTTKGVVMKYDSIYMDVSSSHEETEKQDEKDVRVKPYFVRMNWDGANPDVQVEVQDETHDYFTYSNPNDKTQQTGLIALAWNKLIYHDLYKGIDLEFYYPKDKGGLEYNIILHPGADIGDFRFIYSGDGVSVSSDGDNYKVNSPCIKLTDHAPVATDENGNKIQVDFWINTDWRNILFRQNISDSQVYKPFDVAFILRNYDQSKTITIDPWITATSLGGNNQAFDVGYDYENDAYVYGGGANVQYELQQYNSSGVLQWTYTTSWTGLWGSGYFYGGMTTDHNNGTTYLSEGFNASDANALKVNSLGVQTARFTGSAQGHEFWRIGYDYCNSQLVVLNGWVSSVYAMIIDTNLTAATPENILGGSQIWDQALLGFDNAGFTYIGTSNMYGNIATPYGNLLCQMPSKTLTPTNYKVADHHDFIEIQNITYYPTLTPYVAGNGFNGLVGDQQQRIVLTYDGGKLREWRAATGKEIDSAVVSGKSYAWGGIDLDCEDNIYCGNNNMINVYDTTMKPLGTLPVSNTIYALQVSPKGYIFAGGNDFVQCISIAHKLAQVTARHSGCSCSGAAIATPCGVGPFKYLWSNGSTTDSINNLCAGSYTVTITEENCLTPSDTAIANVTGAIGGGFNATVITVNPTCVTTGSATANPQGGHPPYTFLWSNGGTQITAAGFTAGTYYLLMWDSTDCKDSIPFTLKNPPLPTITATANPDTLCQGLPVTLQAGGGKTYLWSNGATGSSIIATPAANTAFIVTGTDSNGCKNNDTVNVVVNPLPVITITPDDSTVCTGHSVTLTATGALTYSWMPATDLNCTNCGVTTCTPASNETYTVSGTDAKGCTSSAAATVNLELPAAFNLTPALSICEGMAVTLSVQGSGGNYIWEPGNLMGENETVIPTTTTTYSVTLQGDCANRTDTVTVFVNPLPNTGFSTNINSGCSPLCINFRDFSSGNITAWNWKFGNGDSSEKENPLYCYPSPGIYGVTLTAKTNAGCSSTLNIPSMITVYSHPASNFTASPQPATIVYPNIQFTDASTDAYGIIYWQWLFGDHGDSVTSILQNPSHSYSDTGTYCPTLITTNIYGCSDSVTHCLVIAPDYTLYIPNAFTPGSPTGLNTIFEPKGSYISNFEMYIYDRWGMQVYHTTNINNGWNGAINNNGTICQEDTYVYIINVFDVSGTEHKFMGKVTLLK